MEEINKEKSYNVAVYEASFLLLPSLGESQVPAKVSSLKEMVTSAGGQVFTGEDPVLIDLAYPMTKVVQTVRHKANTGYFGWMKFEITTEGIERVKKALDNDESVLRYLIIRTVRENTLLEGKMKLRKEESVKVPEEDIETEDSVKEVVSEEIDKSIDDLVIA